MKSLLKITYLIFLTTIPIHAENLKVLFIGSDSNSEVSTFLDQIVSTDPSLVDTTTSEFYSINNIIHGYYAGRSIPSDSTAFIDKIEEGFDHIVIIPDEDKIYKYPGTYLEEVRLIRNRVQELNTNMIIPMMWGYSSANLNSFEFEDHTYRIGDALDITVSPVGLAWDKITTEQATIDNSNPNSGLSEAASYLLATSAYTEIFQQSSQNSTFTPSSLTQIEKSSIITNFYNEWIAAPLDIHYTGEYTKGYCSPNQIQYDVNNTKSVFMGSSTESGYGGKYKEILTSGGYNSGRTHISRYNYNPQYVFPYLMDCAPKNPSTPEVRDILADNFFDFGFARFAGLTTSHILDFQATSMNSEIPFIGYMYQAYQPTNIPAQLNKISNNLNSGSSTSYNINHDLAAQKVFHIPAEIAWGRLWEIDPSLVQFKGVHVSDQVDAAVASMLYTLLSNENCVEFGNPGKSGAYHAGYELAQNIGYRVIQELGSLKNVPYEIANTKPAAVIDSTQHDLAHLNNYGGGVLYLVDQDDDGLESIALNSVASFDYEGEILSQKWYDQDSVLSSAQTLNTSFPTGTHLIQLEVEDDLNQMSPRSNIMVNVLDQDTIVFDDMEQANNGGYGWKSNSWTLSDSKKVRWDSNIFNLGGQSMNVQNNGTVSRSIDLSAENGELFLEFSYLAKSFESGEYALVEIFNGSWHPLLTIFDGMDDNTWHTVKYDLAPYSMTNDFEVRFTIFGNANNDDVYFDSFKVYRYHPPVALSQNFTIEENNSLAIELLATDEDGDELTYLISADPSNGTLLGSAPNLTYTPSPDFTGNDSFTFYVHDQDHSSSLATISITVEAPNLPPIANAGVDQTLADLDGDGSEPVTLDGSLSTDSDGIITSYIWEEGTQLLTTGSQSTINLAPGEHTITLTVTDDDGATSTDTLNVSVEAYDPRSAPKLAHGTLPSVNHEWQTVNLPETYDSMVVIATPQYNGVTEPLVTRIQNAEGNQFEIRVQNPSGNTTFQSIPVQYFVLEEGIYNEVEHGVKMEAVKYTSTLTDYKNGGLKGQERNYSNSYLDPVVLGQVMTNNDENWSTFWARGIDKKHKPSANVLYTGKSVCEDPNRTRLDETVAYIVIESGLTEIDGFNVQVGVTPNNVRSPGIHTHTASLNVGTVVASPAGMNGGNGGWPIITETPEANSFKLRVDEDQLQDSERNHTKEEVAFIVIE